MNKDIEGCKLSYILIAEDARGCTVVCEAFGNATDARRAFDTLSAPTVCLLKQKCITEIIAHKEKGP